MIGTMVSGSYRETGESGIISNSWRDHPLLVIFVFCVAAELTLVLADLTVNWFRWSNSGAIRRLFNITREDGLASLVAVIQTLVVAVVTWAIYLLTAHQQATRSIRAGWLVLALFFSYMTIDDGAMIHERIGTAFKNANEGINLPSYGWQIVLAPLFVLMGAFMVWFLWRRGNNVIRRDWLLAAVFCLGAAILLDFIEGRENGYQLLVEETDWSAKTIAHFSKSLEEFLEMLGMTFLLITFLNHLGYLTEKTEIRVARRKIWLVERHTDGGR